MKPLRGRIRMNPAFIKLASPLRKKSILRQREEQLSGKSTVKGTPEGNAFDS